LEGKIILQARKEALESILPEELPGVKKMEHDFFNPQLVKDGLVYYFRRVYPDWQDNEACRILQAIIPAIAPDSKILISDMALPELVGPESDCAFSLDVMTMTISGKRGNEERLGAIDREDGTKIGQDLVDVADGPVGFGGILVEERGEEGR
jgi:O-methyltransferase domain